MEFPTSEGEKFVGVLQVHLRLRNYHLRSLWALTSQENFPNWEFGSLVLFLRSLKEEMITCYIPAIMWQLLREQRAKRVTHCPLNTSLTFPPPPAPVFRLDSTWSLLTLPHCSRGPGTVATGHHHPGSVFSRVSSTALTAWTPYHLSNTYNLAFHVCFG